LKVKKLIEELEKLIIEHGENIDIQTFSGQLGVYKELDEIKRICVEE
jgi:hypothetical protein